MQLTFTHTSGAQTYAHLRTNKYEPDNRTRTIQVLIIAMVSVASMGLLFGMAKSYAVAILARILLGAGHSDPSPMCSL